MSPPIGGILSSRRTKQCCQPGAIPLATLSNVSTRAGVYVSHKTPCHYMLALRLSFHPCHSQKHTVQCKDNRGNNNKACRKPNQRHYKFSKHFSSPLYSFEWSPWPSATCASCNRYVRTTRMNTQVSRSPWANSPRLSDGAASPMPTPLSWILKEATAIYPLCRVVSVRAIRTSNHWGVCVNYMIQPWV